MEAKQKQKRKASKHVQRYPTKVARSQCPDIIVAVGEGDNMQEFECYKLILCLASEYFDAMFSHSLKEKQESRIELPDKDPEEWKMFFEFINPSTSANAVVTTENAFTLASWFHEYQMQNLLEKFDETISKRDFIVQYLEVDHESFHTYTFWKDINLTTNLEQSMVSAEKLFKYLTLCEQFSLNKSLTNAKKEMVRFLSTGFDLLLLQKHLVKEAASLFDSHKDHFQKYLSDDISHFYSEMTTFNDHDLDSAILNSLIEARLENLILKRRIEQYTSQRGNDTNTRKLRFENIGFSSSDEDSD